MTTIRLLVVSCLVAFGCGSKAKPPPPTSPGFSTAVHVTDTSGQVPRN